MKTKAVDQICEMSRSELFETMKNSVSIPGMRGVSAGRYLNLLKLHSITGDWPVIESILEKAASMQEFDEMIVDFFRRRMEASGLCTVREWAETLNQQWDVHRPYPEGQMAFEHKGWSYVVEMKVLCLEELPTPEEIAMEHGYSSAKQASGAGSIGGLGE